jgi:hypothetical protein
MKVKVTILDGQGLPMTVIVEVPDNSTEAEIARLIEEEERKHQCDTG